MQITILGTGNVGSVLGTRWAAAGHSITFGTRDPDSPKVTELLKNAGDSASAATILDAIKRSPVIVLALPWHIVETTIKDLAPLLNGKTLIDCTNPLNATLTALTIGHSTSAAEQIAAWVPEANVVKAFNTTGSMTMAQPNFHGEKASMFICGDDESAKNTASQLAQDLGFDVLDSGPLRSARLLEPLAMLWIHLALHEGRGTDFAFKILQR